MKSNLLAFGFLTVLLLLPAVSFAQFQPLVGIPNVDPNNLNFNDYINALYALSISVAGLLAVIKIIIAGVKYMLSDVVTSKAEAKSDIQGALIGLLIVVSAVVILNQINPQLTTTNIFISTIDRPATQTPTPGSGPGNVPLPPPNTSYTRPIPDREFDCTQEPGGGWDCVAARASCTSGGGQVQPEPFISYPGDISCTYGSNRGINCVAVPDSTGESYVADCTEARDSCQAPSIYTQHSEFNGQCFTPFSGT